MNLPRDAFSKISYLMIEMNSQCNLKCLTCTREKLVESGERKYAKMSELQLRHILDQLKDNPIDTIKVEGISEPMLFSEFAERVRLIREYFPKAQIIVITNFQYKISDSPLLKTIELIDSLYISIDGTFQTYERARSPAKYSVFLRNLEELSEKTSEAYRKSKIHLNFTATEGNYLELPQIYSLRDKFGLSSVRINLAQNWDPQGKSNFSFSSKMLSSLSQYQLDIRGVPDWDYNKCFWPENGLVIDVFGGLRQCILNTLQRPIGNVFTESLRDIYNSANAFVNVRESLRKNVASELCSECDYYKLKSSLKEIFRGFEGAPKAREVVR